MKIQRLSNRFKALQKLPLDLRLPLYKSALRSFGFVIFAILIAVLFLLVFYFNFEALLNYQGLGSGNMRARNADILKELGLVFFLPLLLIIICFFFGRNYFISRQVKKYQQGELKLNP